MAENLRTCSNNQHCCYSCFYSGCLYNAEPTWNEKPVKKPVKFQRDQGGRPKLHRSGKVRPPSS